MRRLFVRNINTPITVLDSDNIHYAKTVLRLKNGEKVLIFDGSQEFSGVIEQNSVVGLQFVCKSDEKPLKLAIAAIKQHRFEWLVEKATELGCSEIFILKTHFTQNTIRNLPRVQKIAIEAAKQCGRITIPQIHEEISLDKFLQAINENEWIYGNLDANICNAKNLSSKLTGVIIGPEGGFEKKEIMELQKKVSARKFALNILRAETAALTGLIYISNSLLD